jgi:hypothetical protein
MKLGMCQGCKEEKKLAEQGPYQNLLCPPCVVAQYETDKAKAEVRDWRILRNQDL